MTHTIGTDVEFIAVDAAGNPRSCVGLIGGSKQQPLLVDNGNLQEDNVLAEFAINPASSKEEFRTNIHSVRKNMEKTLTKYGYSLSDLTYHYFSPGELSTKEAMTFGCDPDLNAYTGHNNIPPSPEKVGTLRTCGGHVHVGHPLITDEVGQRMFCVYLDVFLGLPSLSIDPGTERRKMYGAAGSYRPKDYGIEYRTLSNFWVQSKEHIDWVWDGVSKALDKMEDDSFFEMVRDNLAPIEQAINTGDAYAGNNILKQLGVK